VMPEQLPLPLDINIDTERHMPVYIARAVFRYEIYEKLSPRNIAARHQFLMSFLTGKDAEAIQTVNEARYVLINEYMERTVRSKTP